MKKFVISGPPHSGKSTTLTALGALGHQVIHESALYLIDHLNMILGVEACAKWRQEFNQAWQNLVVIRQLALENSATTDVIIDSTPIDSLAFALVYGTANDNLTRLCSTLKYDKVFYLELIEPFNDRKETGRLQSKEDCLKIGQKQFELYTNMGFEVIRVPQLSVFERTTLIAEHVTQIKNINTEALLEARRSLPESIAFRDTVMHAHKKDRRN